MGNVFFFLEFLLTGSNLQGYIFDKDKVSVQHQTFATKKIYCKFAGKNQWQMRA